jgi:hypothetical protein
MGKRGDISMRQVLAESIFISDELAERIISGEILSFTVNRTDDKGGVCTIFEKSSKSKEYIDMDDL